jgi:hypothetical protein
MSHTIAEDIAVIREYENKGGVRDIALRYGRVFAQLGRKGAAEAIGCSLATVDRYVKTLNLAADAGYIVAVKEFTAETEYDFDAVGLTQKVWDELYEDMRYTRADGKKVSKRQAGLKEVIEAVDNDPTKAEAVLDHLMEDALQANPELAKIAVQALRRYTAALAKAAKEKAIADGADEEDFVDDYEDEYDELDDSESGNLLGQGAESVARYDALVGVRTHVKLAAHKMAELVEQWGQTGDPHELRVVRKIQRFTTDLAIAAEVFTFEQVSS